MSMKRRSQPCRSTRPSVSMKEESDDEDEIMQVIECSTQITPPSNKKRACSTKKTRQIANHSYDSASNSNSSEAEQSSSDGVHYEVQDLPKRSKRRRGERANGITVSSTSKIVSTRSKTTSDIKRSISTRACAKVEPPSKRAAVDLKRRSTSSSCTSASSPEPEALKLCTKIQIQQISPSALTRASRAPKRGSASSAMESLVDGSSSDEDEQFDVSVMNKAKDLVKRLYLPIYEADKQEMNKYFKSRVRSPLNNAETVLKYKTFDGTKPTTLYFPKETLRNDMEVAMMEEHDGTMPRPVPIHHVPATTPFPRMKHWVHVEHNIKTDDNLRLSHIPYVDDDHDSMSFCSELKKAYPEGIHGTKHGWNMYISDFLLYSLLKEAIPKWENTGKGMSYLYQAIFRLFPNKMTPRQLEYVFTTLEQRFNPKAAADRTGETSRKEDMHHSISAMLCVKCQQFHCLLHGLGSDDFRMHRKQRTFVREEAEQRCSEHCYKYLIDSDGEEDGDKDNAKPVSRRSKRTEEHGGNTVPFAATSQITFQRMVQNNRHSFCQLAVMMSAMEPDDPRTCQDIFYMAKEVRAPERERSPDDIMERKISVREQQSSFRNFTWSNGRGQVDNSAQPFACRHKGSCGQTVKDCYCGQNNTLCSKYCCCGPDCRMKFPGCRCQPGACRTKQCQCFFAKWECDPDVCRSCNCGPYHFTSREGQNGGRNDCDDFDDKDEASCSSEVGPAVPVPTCSNINIQRGNYKKLRVGISNVAGYGCFIQESAQKGEFISEYTGEVISKWEAERRGRVYDEYKCSYIFALNKEQSIDATRFGNHIRFANHSDKHPNCCSQIIMVNGEHRIGIFAKRHIDVGEELLFDYQYDKKWKEQYVPVEINRAGTICQDSKADSARKVKTKKR